jgi:hypothetical protein
MAKCSRKAKAKAKAKVKVKAKAKAKVKAFPAEETPSQPAALPLL